MTTFTVELYTQGSPTPVAVMRGCTRCTYTRPPKSLVSHEDGLVFGEFLDAEGRQVSFAGLNALVMEEAE